jgi:flagellar hook-basal body complex protein FliE
MINMNSQMPSASSRISGPGQRLETPEQQPSGFSEQIKQAGKAVGQVDDMQQASDASIQDLLTGKNNDITSVVSDVAKADMSFKLLVGVRNKLIEAYKQTMNMQL